MREDRAVSRGRRREGKPSRRGKPDHMFELRAHLSNFKGYKFGYSHLVLDTWQRDRPAPPAFAAT